MANLVQCWQAQVQRKGKTVGNVASQQPQWVSAASQGTKYKTVLRNSLLKQLG